MGLNPVYLLKSSLLYSQSKDVFSKVGFQFLTNFLSVNVQCRNSWLEKGRAGPYFEADACVSSVCALYSTHCQLLEFFVQKVFQTNLNYRPQQVKIQKNKGTFVKSTFKIAITRLSLFFGIFHLLVPKIEICPEYFLDKNFQKWPQCSSWRCLCAIKTRAKVGLCQFWNSTSTMSSFL